MTGACIGDCLCTSDPSRIPIPDVVSITRAGNTLRHMIMIFNIEIQQSINSIDNMLW